jgi:hypothetical protein
MPNHIHSIIMTLYVALAFSFGAVLGGKMGVEQTKKAYGYRHDKLFLRK